MGTNSKECWTLPDFWPSFLDLSLQFTRSLENAVINALKIEMVLEEIVNNPDAINT